MRWRGQLRRFQNIFLSIQVTHLIKYLGCQRYLRRPTHFSCQKGTERLPAFFNVPGVHYVVLREGDKIIHKQPIGAYQASQLIENRPMVSRERVNNDDSSTALPSSDAE